VRFREDSFNIKDLLCNDLEQVTLGKFPGINALKKVLLDLGAEGALMSGSGPSVFGLFRTPQQASMAFQEIKHQQRWDTFLVKLLAP
jgi:4-diphosphocytidyl-2-C-methyl-D-erythritol kinase